MKKRLWVIGAPLLLCALVMAVLPMSAETESVDRVYSALDMFDSFSKKFYHKADEYFFENGLWTVEYYDRNTQSFAPMAAYYTGGVHQGVVNFSNFFTVNEECATQNNDYTYCIISRLGRMHPSVGADAVLTFIAPADGVLSYETVVNAYGSKNSSEYFPNEYGTELSLWQNDTKIWPTEEDRKILSYEMGDVPLVVTNLTVKKGDRIRLSVGAHNGQYQGKGVNLTSLPFIAYHSASVSLKESVQGAPETVWVTDRDGLVPTVTWLAVDNAIGYNIYVGDKKVTQEPIIVERCKLSHVGETQEDITVTAVGPDGVESPHSAPALSIKTESFREFDSKGITYRIGRLLYNERGDVYASIPLPNTDTASETSSSDSQTVSDKTTDTASDQNSDKTSDKETDEPVVSSSNAVTTVTDVSSDGRSDSDYSVTDTEDGSSETLSDPSDGVGVGVATSESDVTHSTSPATTAGVADSQANPWVLRTVLFVAAVIAIAVTVILFLKDRKG
ncbi:MAG: hypothetical protein IJC19_01050 [Clostridia bacterium]|nr:hypothetical protein [Clostridia bacterium]